MQPTNVVAARRSPPAVTVTIEDASGNPVTTATNAVTMAIGTNPSSGTLARDADGECGSGRGHVRRTSASTRRAVVTRWRRVPRVLTGATSSAFNVTAGTASKLAFTVQPTNVGWAAAITPAVTVTIEDARGNPVTTATNAVTMAIGHQPIERDAGGDADGECGERVWPRSRT